MGENRGKKFENVIKTAFEKVDGVSIDRLHDQTTGFKGSSNICDFIVYKEPYEYYIECKSVHGASLPFSNITETQWQGMLEKSKIEGVYAGVICWWIDKDVTRFIPIEVLQKMREDGKKSINYLWENYFWGDYTVNYTMYKLKGKKKRVFFEYDMEEFFDGFNAI